MIRRARTVPPGPFGLAYVGATGGEVSLAVALAAVLPAVGPGGLLAVRDYPDPARPHVRAVVDGLARRGGWRRVAQADFLAAFRTRPAFSLAILIL